MYSIMSFVLQNNVIICL